MQRIFTFSCVLAGTISLSASAAFSATPPLINYQGYLTDDEGVSLSGSYEMQFTIYDDPILSDPGNIKWQETYNPSNPVTVTDGLFTVLLGSVTPLSDTVFNNAERYLGIKVGSDPEISPRTRLASAPYTFRVQTVDGAEGGEISGDLKLHSTLTVGDLLGDQGRIEVTNGSATTFIADGDDGLDGGSRVILADNTGDTTIDMNGDWAGAGFLTVKGNDGSDAVKLDGLIGQVIVTKPGLGGKLWMVGGGTLGATFSMYGPNDNAAVSIVASEDGMEGALVSLLDSDNNTRISLDGDRYGAGVIKVIGTDDRDAIELDGLYGFIRLTAPGSGEIVMWPNAIGDVGAEIAMLDNNNFQTVEIWSSETGADGAQVFLYEADSTVTIDIDAEEGSDGGGIIRMYEDDGTKTVHIDAQGTNYGGAQVSLSDHDGTTTISLDAESGSAGGAFLGMYDSVGTKTIHMDANGSSGGAQVSLIDHDSTTTISLDAESGVNGGANVKLLTGDGVQTIRLDADYGGTGEGRVITDVLEIKGGADLSEQFDIYNPLDGYHPSPGMVVCIDPQRPGKLMVSSKAYDPKVAGIISGAGGIKPGMLMGQSGTVSDGQFAVALTGRVYCRADASYGPIKPGDLLTTSDTPGHAMKATDYAKAQGAIIGKAMSALNKDTGLVLVLVSLQ